jgi:hypothetical protein
MKRGRKLPPRPSGVPKHIFERAKEKLAADYIGFIAGTAEEDPKRYAARMEAAQAAFEHLTQLGAAAGDATDAEPDPDALLRAARAEIPPETTG